VIEYFRPFRERRAELAADPGYVEKTLAEGADKARPVMQETLAAVRAAMNFV
jgi:tryptophanyl-tRNA synthetase